MDLIKEGIVEDFFYFILHFLVEKLDVRLWVPLWLALIVAGRTDIYFLINLVFQVSHESWHRLKLGCFPTVHPFLGNGLDQSVLVRLHLFEMVLIEIRNAVFEVVNEVIDQLVCKS